MVTGGSSNSQWQGSNFASKDVIYVNFNYRESIFGAPNAAELSGELNGTSQNFNILDVEAAVQWVYNNIAGESVGRELCGLFSNRETSFWRQQGPHCPRWSFLRIGHG